MFYSAAFFQTVSVTSRLLPQRSGFSWPRVRHKLGQVFDAARKPVGTLLGDKSAATPRPGIYHERRPTRARKAFSGAAGRWLARVLVGEWEFCLSAEHQSHDWMEMESRAACVEVLNEPD